MELMHRIFRGRGEVMDNSTQKNTSVSTALRASQMLARLEKELATRETVKMPVVPVVANFLYLSEKR
jgi:hypothetical protein